MRLRTLVVVVGLMAMVISAGAQARSRRAVKPSIRIAGLSVNQQNFAPGTKITLKAPINACYGIGGPTQSPRSVQVFVFVHAVKIPRAAPLTFDLTTPWDHQKLPDTRTRKPTFGTSFFLNRGHAGAIFGGATGPSDFYRYDDEGTGGNIFNGRYYVTVTVKVGGKVLRARGGITIACP